MPDHVETPNQLELHEFWVAKIKEIRARSKEDVSGPSRFCPYGYVETRPFNPYCRFGHASSGTGPETTSLA
jgi:hypothetical protein